MSLLIFFPSRMVMVSGCFSVLGENYSDYSIVKFALSHSVHHLHHLSATTALHHLHHFPHLIKLLNQLIYFLNACTTSFCNSSFPTSIKNSRFATFFWCHRMDDCFDTFKSIVVDIYIAQRFSCARYHAN